MEEYIEDQVSNLISPANSLRANNNAKDDARNRGPSSPVNSRNQEIEEEFKEDNTSSGFYIPKIISSDSTVGPNGMRQPKYPLRQPTDSAMKGMKEVNLFEIEEV